MSNLHASSSRQQPNFEFFMASSHASAAPHSLCKEENCFGWLRKTLLFRCIEEWGMPNIMSAFTASSNPCQNAIKQIPLPSHCLGRSPFLSKVYSKKNYHFCFYHHWGIRPKLHPLWGPHFSTKRPSTSESLLSVLNRLIKHQIMPTVLGSCLQASMTDLSLSQRPFITLRGDFQFHLHLSRPVMLPATHLPFHAIRKSTRGAKTVKVNPWLTDAASAVPFLHPRHVLLASERRPPEEDDQWWTFKWASISGREYSGSRISGKFSRLPSRLVLSRIYVSRMCQPLRGDQRKSRWTDCGLTFSQPRRTVNCLSKFNRVITPRAELQSKVFLHRIRTVARDKDVDHDPRWWLYEASSSPARQPLICHVTLYFLKKGESLVNGIDTWALAGLLRVG